VAVTKCRAFHVWTSTFVWRLLNSLIAKASAISKSVCEPCRANSITWASAEESLGALSQMPTRTGIGAIYADFAQVLIHIARGFYADDEFGAELDQMVYALDSTTIDLCLSLFPWARFRRRKGAIKLYTLMDLRGNIPSFIWITEGRVHDVNILDELVPEPGPFYIMDRGYIDFARLHTVAQCPAFFVTHAKTNLRFRRLHSHPINKATGLRCDQTIVLTGF